MKIGSLKGQKCDLGSKIKQLFAELGYRKMPARAELARGHGAVEMNLLRGNSQLLLESLDESHEMLHLTISE